MHPHLPLESRHDNAFATATALLVPIFLSTMTKSWKDLHLGEEALGGLSAGIVGTVIGFPLDLVKTRMQTGNTHSSQTGIFQIGKSIVQTEGFGALYKGIAPPLISLSILNTITFTQYTFYREFYGANPGWDYRNYLAGISCSPVCGLVSTIENLVKVQYCAFQVKIRFSFSFSYFIFIKGTAVSSPLSIMF